MPTAHPFGTRVDTEGDAHPVTEREAEDAGRPRRRIIVDCSLIAPHAAPTGIPRVVLEYVRHGARAAARAGAELFCAEAGPEGFHYRDLGPIAVPAEPRAATLPAKIKLEAARYVSRVLAALARLTAALVPVRSVRIAMGAWEERSLDLVSAVRRRRPSRRRPSGARITFRPGDILFCPGYWHDLPTAPYAEARAAGAEVVFLVHDLLPITMPAHHLYPWRQQFEARVSASFEVVNQYYCISRQTREALLAHAAWQGHSPRATLAYNGFDSAPVPPGEAPADLACVLAEAPWLMVGTLEPKKGHEEAIAVFSRLWSAGYERPLVIIGRQGWMSEAIRHMIRCSPFVGRKLFWFEGMDDGAVEAAMRAAHGLLFASQAEGFGLPLLEAVAQGVPVLARDIPVVREVMGEHGLYFDTRAALVEAVTRLEAPEHRAAVLEQQSALLWWNWPHVAEAVVTDLLRAPAERAAPDGLLDPRAQIPVRPGSAFRKRAADKVPEKVASLR